MERPQRDEETTLDRSENSLNGSDRAFPGNNDRKAGDLVLGIRIFGMQRDKTWHRGRLISIEGKGPSKQFMVRFRDKSKIRLPGNHIAYYHHPPVGEMFEGSKVIAKYKSWDQVWLYAGIVAETPSIENKMRYLIFFIDGFASYVAQTELYAICAPSRMPWEDVEDEPSKEFIKAFIMGYPNRSMYSLEIGQMLTVERKGLWWECKVENVDCSLVKILFLDSNRYEWIYRGSSRLKPTFPMKTFATPTHNKTTSNRTIMSNEEPIIQPTHDQTANEARHGNPARSSLQVMPPPRLTDNEYRTVVQPNKILVSQSVPQQTSYEVPTSKLVYHPHVCDCTCVVRIPVFSALGKNPLLVPLLYDFRRMTAQWQVNQKMGFHVLYKTPCGLSLRTMPEIERYIFETNCDMLFLEMFCLDPYVLVDRKFQPQKPFYYIPDITYGKEDVPLSCVNEIDRTPPPQVAYSKERIPGKGVFINTDPDFLVGCDCTDGCRVRSKCACHQLTVQAIACTPGAQVHANTGYLHKRLEECLPTGIYECNTKCKCNVNMCTNRLVQHGLQVRLQLFKTQKKGWGIRCLDDIAKGSFVCIYAGKILTNDFANEVGLKIGDEYFANLDHIEGAESSKTGYKSHIKVSSTSSGVDIGEDDREEEKESDDRYIQKEDTDDLSMRQSYDMHRQIRAHTEDGTSEMTSKDCALATKTTQGETKDCKPSEEASKNRWLSSNTDSFMDPKGRPSPQKGKIPETGKLNPSGMDSPSHVMDSPSHVKEADQAKISEQPNQTPWFGLRTRVYGYNPSPPKLEGIRRPITKTLMHQLRRRSIQTLLKNEVQLLCNSSKTDTNSREKTAEEATTGSTNNTTAASGTDGEKQRDSPAVVKPIKKQFAVKSTHGVTVKSARGVPPQGNVPSAEGDVGRRTTRQLHDGEELCHIIDAKLEGNLGQYVNDVQPLCSSSKTDTNSQKTSEQSTTSIINNRTAASSSADGEEQSNSPVVIKSIKKQFAVKSTHGVTMKSARGVPPQGNGPSAEGDVGRRTTRQLYDGEESCYIIDAKLEGNLGRYLNHSCSPNLFVQNVFVDTHDLRFPWVAFFANKRIRAGTELTWDYSYEVGAVEGKKLSCHCGSVHCRGRLL